MWPIVMSLMGSPTKNWSKLLTRRSTVVGTLCDAGTPKLSDLGSASRGFWRIENNGNQWMMTVAIQTAARLITVLRVLHTST